MIPSPLPPPSPPLHYHAQITTQEHQRWSVIPVLKFKSESELRLLRRGKITNRRTAGWMGGGAESGVYQDRTGQDRTGQDRTGQDRTG